MAADELGVGCGCESQSCVGGSVEIASVVSIGGKKLEGQVRAAVNQRRSSV